MYPESHIAWHEPVIAAHVVALFNVYASSADIASVVQDDHPVVNAAHEQLMDPVHCVSHIGSVQVDVEQMLSAQLQSGVQVQFLVPGYELLQLSSQVLPIQVLAAQLLSGVQLQVFVPLHVV